MMALFTPYTNSTRRSASHGLLRVAPKDEMFRLRVYVTFDFLNTFFFSFARRLFQGSGRDDIPLLFTRKRNAHAEPT